MNLVKLFQIGNYAKVGWTSYQENAATDKVTVVSGVSVGGLLTATMAVLAATGAVSGGTAAALTTLLTLLAAQIVPMGVHWYQQRKLEQAASAKVRVDSFVDTTGWARTPASEQTADPLGPITPTCGVKLWTVNGEDWHFATSRFTPLGKLLAERPDATSAELTDGRLWVKS